MSSGGGGKSFAKFNSSSVGNFGFFSNSDGVVVVELVDGFDFSLILLLLLVLLLLVDVLPAVECFDDDFPLVDAADILSDLDEVGIGATIPVNIFIEFKLL